MTARKKPSSNVKQFNKAAAKEKWLAVPGSLMKAIHDCLGTSTVTTNGFNSMQIAQMLVGIEHGVEIEDPTAQISKKEGT